MSLKKQSKKKKGIKLSANLKACIALLIIMIVLIPIIVYKLSADKGDYYKIESRINKVKDNEIIENSNYITIGWLRVQGTKLDLPIVYSEVDEDFPVQLEEFVWSENKDDKFHNMIRISGHNIFNLSAHPKKKSDLFHRFEELMSFVYYDFAKDNKYIQLTIDGKDYLYKIFFTGFVSKSQETSFLDIDDYSKKEMKNQLEYYKENSLYEYDVDVDENDKIISLSTCTRIFGDDDQNFYVVGRLVRDNEKIDNYKVTKKDEYKKIEEILKGDEEDAEENA